MYNSDFEIMSSSEPSATCKPQATCDGATA